MCSSSIFLASLMIRLPRLRFAFLVHSFSSDKRGLYHSDSLTRQILRYPFDVETVATSEPCPHPTLVAFGGPGLRSLYITTAM